PAGGGAGVSPGAAGGRVGGGLGLRGVGLPAGYAAAAGLFTAVVPDDELDATVEAGVTKIAAGPRRALELTKQALNQATLISLDAALAAEKAGQTELLRSPDFVEGATAMLTKRKPVFAD
ncbi:enoyl-CoA hydratase-related protein, partial [Nocardia abscessus]|uniref:enoyl-CoA hydratase-related protein n=1 Tax=Nocardia abscessus TaxID=120957 RepID=UPI0024573C21